MTCYLYATPLQEWTALMLAANNGHLSAVQVLVEAKADLKANNVTPLSIYNTSYTKTLSVFTL